MTSAPFFINLRVDTRTQMRHFLFLLSTLIGLTFCQSPGHDQQKEIDFIEKDKFSLLSLQGTDEIVYYNKIEVFDSLMIGLRWGVEDYRLDIVSLPARKIMRTFGESEGPNRLFRVEFTGQFFYRKNSIWCALYSPQRGLFLLDVLSDKPLSASIDIVEDAFELPGTGYFLDTIQQTITGLYMDGVASFSFDLNSEKYDIHGLPSVPSSFNRQGIYAANTLAHTTAWNADRQQFVAAYYFFNRIDLFDEQGQFLRSISIGGDDNPVHVKLDDDAPASDNTFYFGLVDFEGNDVVATYFDLPYFEIYDQQEQVIVMRNVESGTQRLYSVPFFVQSICYLPDKQQLLLAVDDDRSQSNVYMLDLRSISTH